MKCKHSYRLLLRSGSNTGEQRPNIKSCYKWWYYITWLQSLWEGGKSGYWVQGERQVTVNGKKILAILQTSKVTDIVIVTKLLAKMLRYLTLMIRDASTEADSMQQQFDYVVGWKKSSNKAVCIKWIDGNKKRPSCAQISSQSSNTSTVQVKSLKWVVRNTKSKGVKHCENTDDETRPHLKY